MKTTGNIAFIAALLLIVCSEVIGQEEERIKVGDRVRVRVTATEANVIIFPTVGTVVAFEADTLILKAEGQATPLTIPLALLKKLEVSRGRKKSQTLTGAGIGFLSGAVLGYFIGRSIDCGDDDECTPEQGQEGGILVGALGGTLWGTLIGSSMKGESWEEVPL